MVKGMLSEEMEVKAAASEVMGHQGLQNYTEKYTKVDDEKRVKGEAANAAPSIVTIQPLVAIMKGVAENVTTES
ncbi:hypothetical protein LIER_00380 [Lithospermum erythrorhizon]|uniref:Uncharacterized protein n=1 Tax=Lithospermum erythrorhizon TaxID=34254 RepID=A0AAV3NH52_LITER